MVLSPPAAAGLALAAIAGAAAAQEAAPAEPIDRAAFEACLGAAAEGASGSECLVPVRHACNSLLDGGTMRQDIVCLEAASDDVIGWSDEIVATGVTDLTPAQVAGYRRSLRGFCLGQITRGDTVDEVAFGLCELAGHAALHRDILRRRALAE